MIQHWVTVTGRPPTATVPPSLSIVHSFEATLPRVSSPPITAFSPFLSQRITSSPLSLCPPPRPPFLYIPLFTSSFVSSPLSFPLTPPPLSVSTGMQHNSLSDSWGKQTSHVRAHKAELRQGNEVQKETRSTSSSSSSSTSFVLRTLQ